MHRLPVTDVTSVAGSSRARSAIDCARFANAAGPASNVPCPWHGHSCHERRQRHDATSLRFRAAPPPCCDLLSRCFPVVGRRMSARRSSGLNSGRTKCARWLYKEVLKRGCPQDHLPRGRMTQRTDRRIRISHSRSQVACLILHNAPAAAASADDRPLLKAERKEPRSDARLFRLSTTSSGSTSAHIRSYRTVRSKRVHIRMNK
jgi:hypothetical protein